MLGAVVGLWATARGAFASEPGTAESRLLVFLHLDMKQGALQALLRAEVGIVVTAVGRVADFNRELSLSPDAVLTLPRVLEEHGLPVKLQGLHGGSSVEPYLLVGVDRPPRLDNVKKVGVLDFLGHKGMKAFVAELIGPLPSVQRVTKFEDLLPLLQLGMADAIVLPQRLLGALALRSELKLEATELAQLPLPAVTSVSARGDAVFGAIRALSKSLANEMGVDGWR
jgi:hypothetical protein